LERQREMRRFMIPFTLAEKLVQDCLAEHTAAKAAGVQLGDDLPEPRIKKSRATRQRPKKKAL